MKVVISGDNPISRDLAVGLVEQGTNVVLIDSNAAQLKVIRERYDIHTIIGRGCSIDSIEAAGMNKDDLFVALDSEEPANMVACRLVGEVAEVRHTVARLRDARLVDMVQANPSMFNVERVLNPEQRVTDYLCGIIKHPGTFQYLEFRDHATSLVGVKASANSKLTGIALHELPERLRGVEVRVAAIYRHESPLVPTGDTTIMAGDDLFLLLRPEQVRRAVDAIHQRKKEGRRIMIVGGGNIGHSLAQALQNEYQVKIIEVSRERCDALAEHLDNTVVLCGNASDRELLQSEYIENVDVFCAVTNDDEANFLSCLVAKHLGAQHAIAIISNSAYMELVEGHELDVVVSPGMLTHSSLVNLVRPGLAEGYSLRRGAAEVIEAVLPAKSHLVGKELGSFSLPEDTTVGAVVRNDEMLLATTGLKLLAGDKLVVFVIDSRQVQQVENFLRSD